MCLRVFLRVQERNYHIYLNHTGLLKAILLHSGIREDKLSQAFTILCDAMVSARHACFADVFHAVAWGCYECQ